MATETPTATRARSRRREWRLSVCCMVAGAAERAAATLAPLRAAADEIVVALDDRAGDEAAAALAQVADVVVPYPYAEPVDRPLPWLFDVCRSRWVLVVDDDEIASRALLDALPDLVRAEDVTHYWLTRRWLFPDTRRWLDEHPWRNDFQLRLSLRDQRLLRFPDETHRPIVALGPGRYLDLPLYHADCLLKPYEQRLDKARKYERLRPGKRLAGGPMNHVLHLPERRPEARLAEVPDDDLELVASALAARPSRRRARGALREAARREEIDERWAGRALGPQDYRAAIEPLEREPAIRAGERRVLTVRVRNDGGATWPWGEEGQPEIRVAYRWVDAGGDTVVREGVRTPFPVDVPPGAEELVPVHVVAPARHGRHRLVLDLVHERARWFGCETAVDVHVLPARRVALAGDPARVEQALERLHEEEPAVEPLLVERPAPLPPRFGPPRAPDLHAYLFGGAPARRALWTPVLAARSGSLLRAALRRRRGRRAAPLPRGGEALLEGLERTDELRLAGPAEAGTWPLWEQVALAATARALGRGVTVAPGALASPRDPVDAALTRLLRALAR